MRQQEVSRKYKVDRSKLEKNLIEVRKKNKVVGSKQKIF